MTLLQRLSERWGGSLWPEIRIDRDNMTERWDLRGEGRAWCICFEGFGLSWSLFIGPTPPVLRDDPHPKSTEMEPTA